MPLEDFLWYILSMPAVYLAFYVVWVVVNQGRPK